MALLKRPTEPEDAMISDLFWWFARLTYYVMCLVLFTCISVLSIAGTIYMLSEVLFP